MQIPPFIKIKRMGLRLEGSADKRRNQPRWLVIGALVVALAIVLWGVASHHQSSPAQLDRVGLQILLTR